MPFSADGNILHFPKSQLHLLGPHYICVCIYVHVDRTCDSDFHYHRHHHAHPCLLSKGHDRASHAWLLRIRQYKRSYFPSITHISLTLCIGEVLVVCSCWSCRFGYSQGKEKWSFRPLKRGSLMAVSLFPGNAFKNSRELSDPFNVGCGISLKPDGCVRNVTHPVRFCYIGGPIWREGFMGWWWNLILPLGASGYARSGDPRDGKVKLTKLPLNYIIPTCYEYYYSWLIFYRSPGGWKSWGWIFMVEKHQHQIPFFSCFYCKVKSFASPMPMHCPSCGWGPAPTPVLPLLPHS